jgi:hypothetical protein
MTKDDFTEFGQQLVTLAELFEAELSEARLLMYFEALLDIQASAIYQGIREAARRCKFFPKPVELRSFALGDDDDSAELAWREYKRLARTVGGYRSPRITDAALAETILAVFDTWENACWQELSPEMWASKRKEFGRVYRVLRQRGELEPVQLTGVCDRENALRGFTSESLTERRES